MSDADIHSRVHRDRADGRIIFERVQDVAPILDDNKQLAQLPQKGDFRHVASIPLVIIEKWMQEDGVNILGMSSHDFAKYAKRKIEDPSWSYLRTAPKLKPLPGRFR